MKNKILATLGVVILVGIIIVAIFGFNVDWSYKNYNLVTVKIGQEFNTDDVKAITKEVFAKKHVEIQANGSYSDELVLKVSEISDEQKEQLKNKINEKYGKELTIEDVKVDYVPSFRLRDLVKPYLPMIAISFVVVLIYMLVRYKKIGLAKVLVNVVSLPILAEALFATLISITRFPVNRLIVPVGIVIYLSIITFLASCYEKQLKAEDK